MAEVIFEKLRKEFGGFVALDALDLNIRSGEFVSFLGPSGCGKTTTLRMLAGLERPTGGRISIAGRVVNEVPPGKRDIAMVFQNYALYPHMTVARNMEYPLRKRGVPRGERAELIRRAAAILQLEPLLQRKPRELSGGQQQRVALGRALVRDPQVFLLDEPLSNLDAKLRAHMRAELIELHRRIGRTMVYVTHDQLEAMTMSDRIAVLAGGVLQQFGSPDEIYRRPRNAFVAGFVGTPAMNFLTGTLSHREDGSHHVAGSLQLRLPLGSVAGTGDCDAVIGIRPEDVIIGDEGEPAITRICEPAGHETIVQIDCHGHRLTCRTDGHVRLSVGEPVHIRLDLRRIHAFAAADGTRLNIDEEGPLA